ncbi:MAG: class I SAM-dependent methyltransferase [Burkholderiales bacterium]|nr:class I SAM-dependent methyltransferase [Burkholderiales bacterium]
MNAPAENLRLIEDELDLVAELVPLAAARVIEIGCGAAQLARALVRRFAGATVTGLEVDERQHAKNLAAPAERITFVAGGAQAIPFADASFDLGIMLKSLHHVPLPLMAQGLAEAARVIRPGGHLYVSEPVYAGPFNDLVKLFNDEGVVRAAAQAALDAAIRGGAWRQAAEVRFMSRMNFRDFADFETRLMRPTYAEHRIDDAKLAEVRAAFMPHLTPEGAKFVRPNHVRLLERVA